MSFSDLGKISYGKTGRLITDILLVSTQFSFLLPFIVFLTENARAVFSKILGLKISIWYYAAVCFGLLAPLVWVRKISKFSNFHIFADLAIVLTILVVIGFGCLEIRENGVKWDEIRWINQDTWLSFLGIAIFTFEGVGIIIPVYDMTAKPQHYKWLVGFTMVFLTVIYIAFGTFTTMAWGYSLSDTPLITKILPHSSLIVSGTVVIYMFALVFSYPLCAHPINMVLEHHMFKNVPQSIFRKWSKNASRTIIVALSIFIAVSGQEQLAKIISLISTATCLPIAFILPPAFHLKILAKTKAEIYQDIALIVLACVLMVFCI
jgi:proton-coupled amino acid transporter